MTVPTPGARRARLAGPLRAAVLLLVLAVTPFAANQHWIMNAAIFTLMYAALASAWNLVGGYAGYPSLGHAAFFGIGAYTTALIYPQSHLLSSGLEPFWTLPLVGLIAAALGLPVAYIAMRVRTDVFAIVTITLLFVVQTLAFNLRSITGGAQGAGVSVPPFPLKTFERPFYYAMATVLVLAMGASRYAQGSKLGLALAGVRADEDKARGLGVPVTSVKLLAFSTSVALTALVGAIWAYYIGFIYPAFAVDPLLTIGMVLMTFLGGRATLWGPVLGALILVPAQQYLAYQLGASQLYLIGYAAVFLIIMLALPRGIIPTIADKRRRRALARRSAGSDTEAGVSQATTATADLSAGAATAGLGPKRSRG